MSILNIFVSLVGSSVDSSGDMIIFFIPLSLAYLINFYIYISYKVSFLALLPLSLMFYPVLLLLLYLNH
jgi:hypothetical protein